jgi:hypothetical protein
MIGHRPTSPIRRAERALPVAIRLGDVLLLRGIGYLPTCLPAASELTFQLQPSTTQPGASSHNAHSQLGVVFV